ncbi:MAG: copper chaperone PCu(A)C [Proteobacteria bacterium]|nr:MAG: copper chaperone PCu(A)C [Pseudomonadota bacterium]
MTALRLAAALALAALSPLTVAAGMADGIAVEAAHVRLMPAAAPNSAAFLTVVNTAATPVRLVGARSELAQTVELHDHIRDGEIMRMRRIEGIDIAAGAQAVLAPGGKHVMLIGLKRPLVADSVAQITLIFADGSEHTINAPVTPIRPSASH